MEAILKIATSEEKFLINLCNKYNISIIVIISELEKRRLSIWDAIENEMLEDIIINFKENF